MTEDDVITATGDEDNKLMIQLIHFSHLQGIKSAPDFTFDFSQGAIHKCHVKNSKIERLVFCILNDWISFSNWVNYGEKFELYVLPNTLVSVGIGGSFHKICNASEIENCAISLGEILDLNFKFLEVCVPVKNIQSGHQVLFDYNF